MDRSERPRRGRVSERGGVRQSARFAGQYFEVVVQHQRFDAFADRPGMIRDQSGTMENMDAFRTQTDIKTAAGVTNGDRVEALADTDPGLGIDSTRQQQAGIELFDRETRQQRRFEPEVFADSHLALADVTPVVSDHDLVEQSVEFVHGVHAWDRNERAAPEPADLTLDTTLLVGAVHTGETEERVEPVMRTQTDETVVLHPITALQHLDDRRGQIVVTDPARDPTERFERTNMTIEEHLLGFMEIRPPERLTRC